MRDGINREISSISTTRNVAASRLYNLPPELLLAILLSTFTDVDWKISCVLTLGSVCKSWRDLVLAPSFWPTINSEHRFKIVQRVLERNPDGPLTVSLNPFVSIHPLMARPPNELPSFLPAVSQQSHRWKRLSFRGRFAASLWQFMETPSPMLKDFSLRTLGLSDVRDESTQPLRLSEGGHLHHLNVSGFRFHWDTPRLSGLKTLCIQHHSANFPSPDTLMKILASSPELTWLDLRNFSHPFGAPHHPNITVPSTSGIVHLPLLDTLIIGSIHPLLARHLLSHLDAPSCRTFSAIGAPPASIIASPTSPTLLSTPLRTAQILTLSYTVERAYLTFRSEPSSMSPAPNGYGYGYAESGLRLHFEMQDADESLWKDVASCIGASGTFDMHLSIKGPPSPPTVPAFPAAILGYLGGLTKLHVTGMVDLAPMLQHLAQPQPSQDGSLVWPCPRLELFSLGGEGYNQDGAVSNNIVAFVEARYSSGEPGIPPAQRLRVLVPSSSFSDVSRLIGHVASVECIESS